MNFYFKVSIMFFCFSIIFFNVSIAAKSRDKLFNKRSKADFYAQESDRDIKKVAVMPFKGPTDLVGFAFSDMMVTQLLKTRRFLIVERGQIERVIKEKDLSSSGFVSSYDAVEIGKIIGADGVIVGSVSDYAFEGSEKKQYPVAAFSVRLIDTKTGKIVWSIDHALKSKKKNMALAKHGRVVVHDAVSTLYFYWKKQGLIPENKKKK